MIRIVLTLISAASFLGYGMSFFLGSGMADEFSRYKLAPFRKLVGYLQLAGGIGLLAGLYYPPLLTIASGGLAILMLIGFGVRIKMRDGLLASIPSFMFMLLNAYICYLSVLR